MNNSDFKWLMIGMIGIITGASLGPAVAHYSVTQCKVSFAQTNRTADEIKKLCEDK